MKTKVKYQQIKQDVKKDLEGNTSMLSCKVTMICIIRFIQETKHFIYKNRMIGLFLKMYDYMEKKNKEELNRVLKLGGII